jgi:hypothetical protein
MGGMKSAERYDAKEAFNKNLDPKARLHYLENNIADKKGSPASMDASYDDAPIEFNKGLKEAQKQGKLSGEFNTLVKNSSVSRKASPANNVSYGDKSGKTGYIGEAKYDMKYNAVDDITQGKGKADYGMSRQSSPLNGHGYHAKKKK